MSQAAQEVGIQDAPEELGDHERDSQRATGDVLTLPELQAANLGGEPLQVVATTSIIGDVVAQVGGDKIELTTLMGPGQDPHSYQPAARDLTAVAAADVIFVNGWDLEEGLIGDLETIGEDALLLPVSANIPPLPFGHQEEEPAHGHSSADPHTWFSISNVAQWVENVEQVLGALDPANAATYAGNAAAYLADLGALDEYTRSQLAQIPQEHHLLVTNHDSFAYFAHEYGFDLLGTVIPAASTLAEPSASELAGLIEAMQAHGVCTIFAETTVSDTLARTVAGELDNCDQVQVVQLYTGAIGPAGSDADSYVGMFRHNVDAIVAGLTR